MSYKKRDILIYFEASKEKGQKSKVRGKKKRERTSYKLERDLEEKKRIKRVEKCEVVRVLNKNIVILFIFER